jgi:hypothetical protein
MNPGAVRKSRTSAAAGGEATFGTPGSEIPAMGWDRPPEVSRTDALLEDREVT